MNADAVIIIIIVIVVSVLMYNSLITSSDILQIYRDTSSFLDKNRLNITRAVAPYIFKDVMLNEVVSMGEVYSLNQTSNTVEVEPGIFKNKLTVGYPLVVEGSSGLEFQDTFDGKVKLITLADNRIYPEWQLELILRNNNEYLYSYDIQNYSFRDLKSVNVPVLVLNDGEAYPSKGLYFYKAGFITSILGQSKDTNVDYSLYLPVKRNASYLNTERRFLLNGSY